MPGPQWAERWRGRLEHELQALDAAGIGYERVEEAWEQGRLRLRLRLEVDGREVAATARFPDFYPEFRVLVDADPLGLSHHQSPLGGNLCLLGRGSDQWQPSMTLAYLLGEPLRRVLAAGGAELPADLAEIEDPQGEPFSAYYTYLAGSAVLVDGSWVIPPAAAGGTLSLGFLSQDKRIPTAVASGDPEPIGVLRCAVLEVRDQDGTVLASADRAIQELYPDSFRGLWIRRDGPLVEPFPYPAFFEAARRLPERLTRAWQVAIGREKLRVLGILFPEETGHRHSGEGWVFGAGFEAPAPRKKGRARHQGGKESPTERFYYARAFYAGREDLGVRIPSLGPLRGKSIAIFGLGSLGAPAALELARAGAGELRILDRDHADPGPSVRWPLGLPVVGWQKAPTIRDFVGMHYPYTSVTSYVHSLGHPVDGGSSDQNVLGQMLDGASLVLDATAERDVQRLLSQQARERGIPYVAVVGQPGGWGGTVFRQVPERGCWHCLELAQDEGRIPYPPGDDRPGPQARGCGDVTFTGTGFDMATLALDAVRKAVGTLCSGEGGYPDGEWDAAIISFRDADGSACPPRWDVYEVPRDARCPLCASG
jgi:hypothetical protein